MKQEITMGSLFSGSGGFELAGSIFGIRPIWASEIEPFPILVTTKNFPEMKHLGDINKLNGADLEPVTIIAGGSPCQDMSIAGKREGLDGSRSNLFREQIRRRSMEAVMGVRLEQSSSQWHFISHKTRLYSKEKLHALHRAIQRPDKRQLESLFR